MAGRDIGDGAIAGAITGLIIGLVMIVLALIGLGSLARFVNINAVFGGFLPGVGTTVLATVTAVLVFLVFTIIVGLILGAIFGALLEHIPTANLVTKGVIFMLAIWVIFGLLLPIIIRFSTRVPAGAASASIITSLVAAIIWGAILGETFAWVARRAAEPTRPVVRTP
jgi:hypothetical protein